MFEKKTITPPSPHPLTYHLLGAGVLLINKFRYALRGYREPRPFAVSDEQRAIDYDRHVVTNWLDALHDYTRQTVSGKVVLELGPGADLGPALFLLNQGAKQYLTVDANRLIDQTSHTFYQTLLADFEDGPELKTEIEKTLSGNGDRIQYIVDPQFQLEKIQTEGVDVVVSQAAFEHFSDIQRTFSQLSQIVKPGGVLIAEVDLMTHTGAIRSRDPLNIYRYSDFFYRLMNFSGIPNRFRPSEYTQALRTNDWYNVEVIPLQTLPSTYVDQIRPQLARRFQSLDTDMHVLSFLLRATKR